MFLGKGDSFKINIKQDIKVQNTLREVLSIITIILTYKLSLFDKGNLKF